MLEFINENWSEILSVIGAAAWLPVIFSTVINKFRKVHITVLDSRVLTNAFGISVESKQKKKGTILLLATNMFIKKTTFFARNILVDVKLNNGASLKTELLDFSGITSNNSDDTESTFDVSVRNEFNISRTLYANEDNIKYIAVLVESATFSTREEIDVINIYLSSNRIFKKIFAKKIVIKSKDFPTFNSSHLIDQVERIHKKTK